MSVLVAGTTGAIAHHVIDLLPREKGPLVAAGLRLPPPHLQRADVQYIRADLRDPEEARRLFEYHQPSDVIHLAGRWSVHSGEQEPEEALLGNVSLARNVLEACRRSCPGARILFQSSAEVYGRGPAGQGAEIPRLESDPALPLSTTGAALACGEILTRQYALGHGLRVVVARPFNVVGPYLSRQFLAGELAWQLSRIKVERGEPVLYAGDLEVERDYVDVRDLARAYLLLLEKGEPGESYNVASGRAVPVRQVAEDLVALSGGGIEIRFDPRRERNAEIPMLVGSIDKIRRAVGWSPAIPLKESLRDLWKEKLERMRSERKGTPC
ncbi:MAG: GDP-4-dehydro-6-deoxy-D-mannose reductase [Fibrobacterota bacterium]|jgi:GDP-4-dehydro-6-deoxy-D-mannose reductase